MKIKTTRFGEIEIPQKNIIRMPNGMIGLPDQTTFAIVQHKKESPLLWYQSLKSPELAFVITNPFLFVPDYQVDMKTLKKDLPWPENVNNENHLMLYVVVNIPQNSPDQMTANLIGPIVVNHETCQAAQAVIADSSYSHQHKLIS